MAALSAATRSVAIGSTSICNLVFANAGRKMPTRRDSPNRIDKRPRIANVELKDSPRPHKVDPRRISNGGNFTIVRRLHDMVIFTKMLSGRFTLPGLDTGSSVVIRNLRSENARDSKALWFGTWGRPICGVSFHAGAVHRSLFAFPRAVLFRSCSSRQHLGLSIYYQRHTASPTR